MNAKIIAPSILFQPNLDSCRNLDIKWRLGGSLRAVIMIGWTELALRLIVPNSSTNFTNWDSPHIFR